MPRMLQIYDEDLSDLERTIPQVADRLLGSLDNAMRIKLRRVQKILSNVRWGYGPPSHVEKLCFDEGFSE